MALLGSDFNAEQPADNDLAKNGARWIRDTKDRLKKFVEVMFDSSTGLLKSNTVQSSMLAEQAAAEGTWDRVTVNSKGLVTAGEQVTLDTSKQKTYFALYGASKILRYDHVSGAWVVENAPASPNGTDSGGRPTFEYSFAVPTGVSRLIVSVFGSSGGGGYANPVENAGGGGGGSFYKAIMEVTPSSNLPISVGTGGSPASSGSSATAGAATRAGTSTFGIQVSGGGAGEDGTAGSAGAVTINGATGIYPIWKLLGQDGAVGNLDGTVHYVGQGGYGAAFTMGGPTGTYGIFATQNGGRGSGPTPGTGTVEGTAADTNGDSGLVMIEYIA